MADFHKLGATENSEVEVLRSERFVSKVSRVHAELNSSSMLRGMFLSASWPIWWARERSFNRVRLVLHLAKQHLVRAQMMMIMPRQQGLT